MSFSHFSPNYKSAIIRPKIKISNCETHAIFVFSFQCQSEALIVNLNKSISDTVPLKYISMRVACFNCTNQHKLSSGTGSVPTYFLIPQTLGCQAGLIDKKHKKPNTSTHRAVKTFIAHRRTVFGLFQFALLNTFFFSLIQIHQQKFIIESLAKFITGNFGKIHCLQLQGNS